MPVSSHVTRLRALVGPELLLLPSVAVLPRDGKGRVLLVRHADTGLWGLIGGTIEIDEGPESAARREALEETGARVELGRLLGAFGGPEYCVTYPNGDRVAYVVVAYDARVVSGTLRPDGEETTEVAWVEPNALSRDELNSLAVALLHEAGLRD